MERERDARLSQYIVTIQKVQFALIGRMKRVISVDDPWLVRTASLSATTTECHHYSEDLSWLRGATALSTGFHSVVFALKTPRYFQIRLGFARLQAIIRARQLVTHYNRLRYIVIQLQVIQLLIQSFISYF